MNKTLINCPDSTQSLDKCVYYFGISYVPTFRDHLSRLTAILATLLQLPPAAIQRDSY